MKRAPFAALCLGALAACEVDHSLDTLGYKAEFSANDEPDEPTVSLSVRFRGDRSTVGEALAVQCDGVALSVSYDGRDALGGIALPEARSFVAAESVPRRQAGESYACVVTWPGGERTFRLPQFDRPVLTGPVAGATVKGSEPIEFTWQPAASTPGETSAVDLAVTPFVECDLGHARGFDAEDVGHFSEPGGWFLGPIGAPCPATVELTRTFRLSPPSEGAENQKLGLDNASFEFVSRAAHEVVLAP